MFRLPRNNPILTYQVRNAHWPSLRTTQLIAIALTVIELALIIAAFQLSPRVLFYDFVFILLVEALLVVISPLVTGVVALRVTKQFITSEAYQIVRLSQLVEHQIIKGFVSGTLFRMRAVWMIAGGLWLPLIVILAYVSLTFDTFLACVVIGPGALPNCIPAQPLLSLILAAGIVLLFTGSLVVLVIVWNRLAATLGVWMAFRIHHTVRALTVVLLLSALFIALQAYLTFVVFAIPCVVLMFAGFNMWLVRVASWEAVRACEAHARMNGIESLLS